MKPNDDNSSRPTYSQTFRRTVGGALAGMTEAVLLHPTDTIKTRLQNDSVGQYRGVFHCARSIVREEGAKALYKGLTPFTTHLVTKYSLRFYTNSIFRSMLADSSGKNSPASNFVAGMMSGITEAILIVTPFETVKTRLQNQRGLQKSQLKYKGPVHAAATMIREEGPLALLNGVAPTIVRNASNQAINFMTYDYIRTTLWQVDHTHHHLETWKTLVTGFVAGAIGPIVNSPADVIKTRLMSQQTLPGQSPKYRGLIHCFQTVRREEGMAALYRGLPVRLARIAPGQAITWTVVEKVNSLFQSLEDASETA